MRLVIHHLYICIIVSLYPIASLSAQDHNQVAYDLKQTYINQSILSDTDGFLWYCTLRGKVIKDFGETKVTIPLPKDLDFKQTNSLYKLFQDSKGNIWVGHNAGAYVINPYSFEYKLLSWKPENSDSNTGFLTFIEKKDGTIITITESNHIILFKDYKILPTYNKIPFLKNKKIQKLHLTKNYYDQPIVSQVSILGQLNGPPHKLFLINDNNEIEYIASVPYRSKLFFLQKETTLENQKGLFYYNNRRSEYLHLPRINACALIIHKDDFSPPILPFSNQKHTTSKNDIVIEKRKDKIEFYLVKIKPDTIFFSNIYNLENQSKTVYTTINKNNEIIISESNAINKLDLFKGSPKGIKKYLDNPKDLISTRGISVDSLNNIYIASYNGFYKIDQTQNKESLFLKEKGICSTIKENDSIVWGIEDNHLHKINVKTRKNTVYSVPYASSVLERKNNHELWIGSTRGLYLYNTNSNTYKDFNQLNKQHNIKHTYIKDILQLPDSTIWIATYKKGAYHYDLKTESVKHYSKDNPQYYIPHDLVLAIYKDKNESLWIGGNQGLTCITKNNKTINYSQKNGLSNDIVCGILETKNYLWASTYSGINRIELSKNPNVKSKIKHLLYDIEFNHKSLFKQNDSTLFFGGIDGVYKINTTLIPKNNPKINIYPVLLKAYSKAQDAIIEQHVNEIEPLEINLNYYNNFFELELALSNTYNYKKNSYRYIIKGITPKWLDINYNRIRQYGIPPGNYVLKIMGKNDTGLSFSNTLSIPIYVSQVFYKTTVFIVTTISILSIMCFLFLHFYLLRKKNINIKNGQIKELEIQALRSQMNPHFIFNTINGIQSDIIFKTPDVINDHISSFAELLRITMDMSVKNTISLELELEYLEAYIKLQQHRLEHMFSYDIKLLLNQYKSTEIQIPTMLFQPLIENAIIHGLETKKETPRLLKLTFKIINKNLIACVEDNGIGRKPRKNKISNKSHALSIMENRININNEINKKNITMKIIDKQILKAPLGTKIILTIPFHYKAHK